MMTATGSSGGFQSENGRFHTRTAFHRLRVRRYNNRTISPVHIPSLAAPGGAL